MVPSVAQRGHSFVGAGKYYLHDKGADTSERVGWTRTYNLSTNDPDKAMRMMAWTAMHADDLKAQAGVAPTGRTATTGAVYSYSLAWAPNQKPNEQEMREAVESSLRYLRLQHHEAVAIQHTETAHPHVHVVVNLVDPDTGKRRSPYNDHLIHSKWAEEWERNHGGIIIKKRQQNNAKRDGGEYVKHRPEKVDHAAEINRLFKQSDSPKAFKAALEQSGYALAQGDKRGVVLVADDGKILSLARQLEGQRAKDIKAYFRGHIDTAALPDAATLSEFRKQQAAAKDHAAKKRQEKTRQAKKQADETVDRDAQTQANQDAIEDAAIAQAVAQDRERAILQRGQDVAIMTADQWDKQLAQIRAEQRKATQERQIDGQQQRQRERLKWEEIKTIKEAEFRASYNRDDYAQRLRVVEEQHEQTRGFFAWLTGRKARLAEEAEGLKLTLANIDWRIAEKLHAEKAETLKHELAEKEAQAQRTGGRPATSHANENTPDIAPTFDGSASRPSTAAPDALTPKFDREAYIERRTAEMQAKEDAKRDGGRSQGDEEDGPAQGISR